MGGCVRMAGEPIEEMRGSDLRQSDLWLSVQKLATAI